MNNMAHMSAQSNLENSYMKARDFLNEFLWWLYIVSENVYKTRENTCMCPATIIPAVSITDKQLHSGWIALPYRHGRH